MHGPGRTPATREAYVVFLDMAAVAHIIKPQRASVFGEYTKMQLLPYLESHMMDSTTRVDAIWDTYMETSLKSQTRIKRGGTASCRTRVSDKIPIPKGAQWQLFLKDRQNKDDLSSSSVWNCKGHSQFTVPSVDNKGWYRTQQ